MTKATKTHTIRVALKLPKRIGDFIVRAQTIHDQFVANSVQLPSPPVAPTQLVTQIDDLKSKDAQAKLRTSGAASARDSSRKVLADSLNSERGYVEQLVNADPANADEIAKSAGMTLRVIPSRHKSDLAVKPGKVSGSVQVVAKATKGAKTYAWQQSTDGGKTWVDLPLTTKASTQVQNLTPGTTVSFRTRSVTKTGVGDWGQDVSHLVT